MVDETTGYTKIGRSANPLNRETTLLSSRPTIKLLYTCDRNIESLLHKAYASKRVRGEWFALTELDIKKIVGEYSFKAWKYNKKTL